MELDLLKCNYFRTIDNKKLLFQSSKYMLTIFLVEDDLDFELLLVSECTLDGLPVLLVCIRAPQEFARAALLHDLRARPACQFEETVRAVDDRVRVRWYLRVSQHKVRICGNKWVQMLFSLNTLGNRT